MDTEYKWFIGVQKMSKDNVKSSHALVGKKPISDEDREKVKNIAIFLNELTEASPYKKLKGKYFDFNKYVADTAEKYRGKSPTAEDLEEIKSKFDDLLSALRAFDDITKHNLSKRYGKESLQFSAFETALSFEYDNVFAYRLCGQLRNYSQHAGSPLTEIQY